MCNLDYDPPTMYARSIVRARKQRRCGECRRMIGPGEKYHRTAGVWDGTVGVHVHCAHCERGVQLLQKECNGGVHGGVLDELSDHVDPALPWAMQAARTVVGMRRK